jgi:hypothetical protein
MPNVKTNEKVRRLHTTDCRLLGWNRKPKDHSHARSARGLTGDAETQEKASLKV